jgi:hypothetical protein
VSDFVSVSRQSGGEALREKYGKNLFDFISNRPNPLQTLIYTTLDA